MRHGVLTVILRVDYAELATRPVRWHYVIELVRNGISDVWLHKSGTTNYAARRKHTVCCEVCGHALLFASMFSVATHGVTEKLLF